MAWGVSAAAMLWGGADWARPVCAAPVSPWGTSKGCVGAEPRRPGVAAVLQVAESMAGGLPIDFWTIDLRSALIALGEVSGDEVRHWSCLLPVLAALAERVGRAVRPHCCQVAVP